MSVIVELLTSAQCNCVQRLKCKAKFRNFNFAAQMNEAVIIEMRTKHSQRTNTSELFVTVAELK